jgi:hypothetical protein
MKMKYKEEGLERFIFTMDTPWALVIIVEEQFEELPTHW